MLPLQQLQALPKIWPLLLPCSGGSNPYIVLHYTMVDKSTISDANTRPRLNRASELLTNLILHSIQAKSGQQPNRTSLVELYSTNFGFDRTACSAANCARKSEPTILPTIILAKIADSILMRCEYVKRSKAESSKLLTSKLSSDHT